MRGGGVHLLAVNDVVVTVLRRAALQTSEVRTTRRFGEALSESDLTGDELGDVVILLLLGAADHDRGTGATTRTRREVHARELFLDDVLVESVRVLATVLLRPAHADPAALAHLGVDGLRLRAVLAFALVVEFLARDLLGDELLDLLLESPLRRCVFEFHANLRIDCIDRSGHALIRRTPLFLGKYGREGRSFQYFARNIQAPEAAKPLRKPKIAGSPPSTL